MEWINITGCSVMGRWARSIACVCSNFGEEMLFRYLFSFTKALITNMAAVTSRQNALLFDGCRVLTLSFCCAGPQSHFL